MKKIYFIRHGESEGNAKKIHQSKETPLSDIGQDQAKILALRFKNIQTDLIIASPYLRAQQTAQAIATKNNLQIETNELFSERRGPSELIGVSQQSIISTLPSIFADLSILAVLSILFFSSCFKKSCVMSKT